MSAYYAKQETVFRLRRFSQYVRRVIDEFCDRCLTYKPPRDGAPARQREGCERLSCPAGIYNVPRQIAYVFARSPEQKFDAEQRGELRADSAVHRIRSE